MILKKLLFVVTIVLAGATLLVIWYVRYSSVKHIEFESRKRAYLLHVPPAKNAQSRHVIFMLHGYGDHPRLMELYSGMSKKADSDGTIVVYPYGTNNSKDSKLSWNGGSCCAAALDENVNDVGFLDAIVKELSSTYTIDTEHISVAGFSNGAIMAQKFVVESATPVRSMALVSSAVGGKRTKDKDFYTLPPLTKHVRVMLLHGQLDHTIPMQGGVNAEASASWEPFDKAVAYWQPLEVHIIPDRGHVWFGSILEIVFNMKWPGKFSATDAIWKFFKE